MATATAATPAAAAAPPTPLRVEELAARYAEKYSQLAPDLVLMVCEQLSCDDARIETALLNMAADIPLHGRCLPDGRDAAAGKAAAVGPQLDVAGHAAIGRTPPPPRRKFGTGDVDVDVDADAGAATPGVRIRPPPADDVQDILRSQSAPHGLYLSKLQEGTEASPTPCPPTATAAAGARDPPLSASLPSVSRRRSLRARCLDDRRLSARLVRALDSDTEESAAERRKRAERVQQKSLQQLCRRLSTVRVTEGPFGNTVRVVGHEPEEVTPPPSQRTPKVPHLRTDSRSGRGSFVDRSMPCSPSSLSGSTACDSTVVSDSAVRSVSAIDECVVCMDGGRSVLILPCRHLCLCTSCATLDLEACPLCRGAIDSKMEVYLS